LHGALMPAANCHPIVISIFVLVVVWHLGANWELEPVMNFPTGAKVHNRLYGE